MSEGDVQPPKMVVAEAHNIGKTGGTPSLTAAHPDT